MDVLKFEKNITTEALDPQKIKYYYLATSYDVNYLTKATYEYREFAINATPSQFEAMKQEAEQNKISVEEQIKGDVNYVTKRHGLINFQDARIYYFVNEFLSKKTQNEYITKKAQENGVPVNQMIFGDAGWLLRKEQKY
jgi:predicted S18 family serine protease